MRTPAEARGDAPASKPHGCCPAERPALPRVFLSARSRLRRLGVPREEPLERRIARGCRAEHSGDAERLRSRHASVGPVWQILVGVLRGILPVMTIGFNYRYSEQKLYMHVVMLTVLALIEAALIHISRRSTAISGRQQVSSLTARDSVLSESRRL